MVLNNNDSSSQDGSNPLGDSYPSQAHHGPAEQDPYAFYDRMFPRGRGFGHFGGRGGFRGGGFRGGMMGHGPGHPRMHPSEAVSLDGEYEHPHPHPRHPPHPPHAPHPHAPPPFDWRGPGSAANPGDFADPPLAPMPPGSPRMGPSPFFNMPDMAGLFGHHARNFYGDFMAQVGGDQGDHHPQDGSPEDYDAPSAADAAVATPMRSGPFFGRGRGGFGRGGVGGPRGRHGWRHEFGPHDFPYESHHRGEFVYPRMDILEVGYTYIVTIELPGLTKQDVDISVKEGLLIISGEFVTIPKKTSGSSKPVEDIAEYEVMDDNAQEQLLDDFLEKGDDGKDGSDGKGRFLLHERDSGKFKRSLKLPAWVKVDAIKATMTQGVLKLVFEKPEPENPSPPERKVNIL